MNKRIISLVALVIIIMLALTFGVHGISTIDFEDVKEDDYFFDSVSWAVDMGITNGTDENHFSPNEFCTRGQIVTFLYRAAGSPVIENNIKGYNDIYSEEYYYSAVIWAINNGITNGTSETTFSPNDICTRGQCLTFIYRAVLEDSIKKYYNPFFDVNEKDYFYYPVIWAYDNNITTGTLYDEFSPNAFCTRGQIVTFIKRTILDNSFNITTSKLSLKTDPLDGECVSLLDGNIYSFVKNYSKGGSEEYYTGLDQYAPRDFKLQFSCDFKFNYYVLKISCNSDLSDYEEYASSDKSFTLKNLLVGKDYYYTITGIIGNKRLTSEIRVFATENYPRTISLPTMFNTRDIGGYYVNGGNGRIKQGMIYRGSASFGMDAVAHKEIVKTINLKTDLDLREEGSKVFSYKIQYIRTSCPCYIGYSGIDDPDYQDALRDTFKVFANKDNYPIYMHCRIGRDRTGTVSAMLELLLGCSEQDVYMDYELSRFSQSDDTYGIDHLLGRFDELIDYLRNYSTGSLQDNVEQFLLDIGVTKDEIQSIREILIEE